MEVSEDALKNGVNIINSEIGTPLHKLHYRTSNGDYLIDTNEANINLEGTEKSFFFGGGNDHIWGRIQYDA